MKSSILLIFLVFQLVAGDVSHIVHDPVDENCMNCLCQSLTGCDPTTKCVGDVCGMFRITWPYWADAGKPTQPGEDANSQTAYPNCVNDRYCAERTIQGYMSRFQQDCTGDGVVNCYDFAAIHKLGGYGCKGYLPEDYKQKIEQCYSSTLLDVRVGVE